MADTFLLNTETGVVHRLREGHLSDERCNLDAAREAGHLEELTDEDATDLGCTKCAWCQPPND